LLCLALFCCAALISPASWSQPGPYRDKVAIITGTSSGLGLELAKLGAEKGMKLVLVDVDPPGSVELADRINAEGGEAIFVHADLAEHEDRSKVVNAARDRFERIDYLMNNAGYIYSARLDQMDLNEAHRLFEVNYWAYVDLANQVIPLMKEQGSGTILNVSSILGLIPGSEGQGHYAATKHALMGMFQTAAKELAPHGIKVFVAAPGGMQTDIAKNAVGPLADERRDRAEDWQDPAIPARDIFEAMQGDEVVFRPGYIGDVPLEQLRQ
jgi:NAD(P)-dependent dehydrogenase (short-subunit alcohol dehydrogenase family)